MAPGEGPKEKRGLWGVGWGGRRRGKVSGTKLWWFILSVFCRMVWYHIGVGHYVLFIRVHCVRECVCMRVTTAEQYTQTHTHTQTHTRTHDHVFRTGYTHTHARAKKCTYFPEVFPAAGIGQSFSCNTLRTRAGHLSYFLIVSIIKNDLFAFFIKLITYFFTSPI